MTFCVCVCAVGLSVITRRLHYMSHNINHPASAFRVNFKIIFIAIRKVSLHKLSGLHIYIVCIFSLHHPERIEPARFYTTLV